MIGRQNDVHAAIVGIGDLKVTAIAPALLRPFFDCALPANERFAQQIAQQLQILSGAGGGKSLRREQRPHRQPRRRAVRHAGAFQPDQRVRQIQLCHPGQRARILRPIPLTQGLQFQDTVSLP